MQTSTLQMFIFTQSLVTKIKFPDTEITRVAPAFRNQYKKARGLKRNATALEVLRDVRAYLTEVGHVDEFNRATMRYREIVAML